MLTIEDTPTIRYAITRRLNPRHGEGERGVKICDIAIKKHRDCIAVGVLALVDHKLIVRSRFDLPLEFEISHLHNEVDEIAEQYKAARRDYGIMIPELGRDRLGVPERHLLGTGLRGRW